MSKETGGTMHDDPMLARVTARGEREACSDEIMRLDAAIAINERSAGSLEPRASTRRELEELLTRQRNRRRDLLERINAIDSAEGTCT